MKCSQPLCVVHIITKLEMGGAQKVCLTLKKGLDAQGIWTALISGTCGQLVESALQLPHTILIKEFTREVSLCGMFNEVICFIKLIKALRSLKKSYSTLIVHTHSTKAGLMGRWAAFFAGIKHRIHTIHGYGFHQHQFLPIRFLIYLVELFTSIITTHYICVSSVDAKRGERIFPRFRKKYSIIRAAIDWNKFTVAIPATCVVQKPSPVFVIGTSGCFRKGKNHFELFKAFEKVHDVFPHVRLELLGDGILRSSYEQWIVQHNLQDAIVLHGWHYDVVSIMRTWHAFAFTSLWEGMPCSLVEARLLKLPVLTYNTGGVQDVIFNNKNGFIYKQHDWQGIADGLLTLIHDQELYVRLRLYPDDLHDFNDAHMIHKHIELYKKIGLN